jgi:hypothetical protein
VSRRKDVFFIHSVEKWANRVDQLQSHLFDCFFSINCDIWLSSAHHPRKFVKCWVNSIRQRKWIHSLSPGRNLISVRPAISQNNLEPPQLPCVPFPQNAKLLWTRESLIERSISKQAQFKRFGFRSSVKIPKLCSSFAPEENDRFPKFDFLMTKITATATIAPPKPRSLRRYRRLHHPWDLPFSEMHMNLSELYLCLSDLQLRLFWNVNSLKEEH